MKKSLLLVGAGSLILSPIVVAEAIDKGKVAAEPGPEQVKTLAPIEIKGEQDNSFINQDRVSQSFKQGLSVHETPASISVVNQQFIRDTGAKNIQDALLYTSGVYAGNFGFDTRGDWKYVRGLNASDYLDGLRSIYGSYNSVRTNVYSLEHIEVLKGPSSSLYGQSDLGGIVNGVSKLPKPEAQGEIWAQVGSHERKQLATDITGPVTDDGKWLFRLVALGRDSGTQVDHVDDDGYVLAPSITWKPQNGTEITLLLNRQENKGQVSAQFLPSRGTIDPAPRGRIPTNTFVGEPGWDRYDRERTEVTLFVDQKLAENWKVSGVLRKSDSSAETREHWIDVGVVPDDEGNATRTLYQVDRETDVLSFDVRAQGKFDIGITRHTLTVGIDRQDALWKEGNYFYGYGQGGTINLYDPQYGNLNRAALANTFDRPDNEIVQTGIYIVDSMEIGNALVSAALRRDDSETTTIIAGADNVKSEDKEITGRIGLMYRFDMGINPYISYAESFVPNLGTDQGGSLDPTTGEQKEIGVKYLSPNKDLSASLAWFDIEEEKRVVPDSRPDSVRQIGATVEGWELEVKKRWDQAELLATYTDLKAEEGETGTRLPYVAEKQASIWGKYDFTNGIRVGLGARYNGDNVGFGGGPLVSSATLYDAMLGYSLGDWDFGVDAKNLTDKTYVSWCRSAGTDCGYGERRMITGNVKYLF
ncbi:iron(III) compound receptor [Oleiphilus messinensis]|uniref:Iron(III) compound receptor n=1 Tax=Oleiphilus messinensis TaxID=141451 RepID=A0A1Y0IF41_9GAMM|nr:TonB-dependent siderophore receptor [Oleiphilus messinensis]ARU59158.1 iron(III) compound receptor [Oleiphilus messinensis]